MKIKEGLVVTKVEICKDDNIDDEGRGVECECTVVLSNNFTISFILDDCELLDDKYTRGIYQYKDDKFIQIENWES